MRTTNDMKPRAYHSHIPVDMLHCPHVTCYPHRIFNLRTTRNAELCPRYDVARVTPSTCCHSVRLRRINNLGHVEIDSETSC